MLDEGPTRSGFELPTPTARELAWILFRQRRVFAGVFALVVALSMLYAIFGTKYQAHMKILVRRGRADTVATARQNAPVDTGRLAVTEEDLNSEVELVRDSEVLRKVVEENHLSGSDWLHFLRPNESEAAQIERSTRRLAAKLQVEVLKKTNLVVVSYGAKTPALAARVLQSLAKEYVEKHKRVHRPAGELLFFDQQTEESARQLEAAKQQLLRFVAANDVIAAGEQRDLALQKLFEAEADRRQARMQLAETEQRVRELTAQLKSLQERTTTQVRIADNPELLKSLKSSLLDLELKRTQLLTKFEPGHRLVQEIEQQIAQAKSAIATEMLAPLRDETTDKNPSFEWAKSELQQAEVQLKALQSRASTAQAQVEAYRSMARQMGEDAFTQDTLLSTEKTALENYQLYLRKREEARMEDALDQLGIVNVAIAEEPVAPALPIRSAWMVMVVGIVVAGASGTTAAFAADYLDPAFRTPDEVTACLSAPVLASLPKHLNPPREAA